MPPSSLLLLSLLLASALANCPNKCHGNGRCVAVNRCECFAAWTGGDCSRRVCPSGLAWTDVAIAADTAHQPAECSNRGTCDTETGRCTCAAGFEGPACNRMSCPNSCGAHGTCQSMRFHATQLDKGLQPRAYYFSYGSNWDADAIFGCSCDAGYTGYSCGERLCPMGDDPLTTGQLDDVQLLRCDLPPTPGVSFRLSFRGAVSAPFASNAAAASLRAVLEALPTAGSVSVSYSAGVSFCNVDWAGTQPPSANIVAITFLAVHGPQPALLLLDEAGALLTGAEDNAVDSAHGGGSLTVAIGAGASAVVTSITGNKEWEPCSRRGVCSSTSGLCSCYPGFGASDGRGAIGSLPDCGAALLPIASCPGASVLSECSGHGTCIASAANTAYTCACNAGWSGGACAERTCAWGGAWFDFPSAVDTAHAPAECSGKGRCSRASGACECAAGLEGAACERSACPGRTLSGAPCSGHGTCLTQAALAATRTENGEAAPASYGADAGALGAWDALKLFGCACEAGWRGFDCSLAACAEGEEPTAREWAPAAGVDEVQALTCTTLPGALAGAPTLRLRFREASTPALAHDAPPEALAAALAALPTIRAGGLTLASVLAGSSLAADTLCAPAPGVTTTFTFSGVHGDLPPLRVAMAGAGPDGGWAAGDGWSDTQLQWAGGDPASAPSYDAPWTFAKGPDGFQPSGVSARELTKGAATLLECSGRGLCEAPAGLCSCFRGYGPSDGQRGKGSISDCGYREPYWPQGLRGAGEA